MQPAQRLPGLPGAVRVDWLIAPAPDAAGFVGDAPARHGRPTGTDGGAGGEDNEAQGETDEAARRIDLRQGAR